MTCCTVVPRRTAERFKTFRIWFFAAMQSSFAVTIVLSERWLERGPVAWGITAATIVFLILAVRAYIRYLREADELIRKIQTEALSFSFGASAVFMIGWRLCERLGAFKLDVDDPLLVMVLFWAAGQWVGSRRYSGDGEELEA